ncbi:MAG: hypothetical protein GXP42_09150 [Chloroflexi bacterium]|nr:hypothetical protein [Chloroflexota bacterium]
MYEPSSISARRKAYLALAKKRTRPGSGSSPAHLRSRTSRQPIPDLAKILGDAPYVVVGAMAARLYMPERMTHDVDALVLASDLETCERRLQKAGAHKTGSLAIGGSTWRLPDGTELDLIASDAAWASEALARPVMADTGLPTIPLPYLVVRKLLSGRAQDIADMTRMLGAADEATLAEVRRVVAKHAPDALEDVESMITLGRMEYESE